MFGGGMCMKFFNLFLRIPDLSNYKQFLQWYWEIWHTILFPYSKKEVLIPLAKKKKRCMVTSEMFGKTFCFFKEGS